jgi:hypothetical protein
MRWKVGLIRVQLYLQNKWKGNDDFTAKQLLKSEVIQSTVKGHANGKQKSYKLSESMNLLTVYRI